MRQFNIDIFQILVCVRGDMTSIEMLLYSRMIKQASDLVATITVSKYPLFFPPFKLGN